ncbi:MAG TPA: hypothetical protein VK426_11885 [Methanobacterium sp.]|nr:hypothetical protein [Methanobacterium sp.]
MNLYNFLKSPKNRIIITIFLLAALLGLFFYYNINFETNSKYPSTKSILSNYPEGETVYVSGIFHGYYNGGFYIIDPSYGNKVTYKINSSYTAENGDTVSIIGTLGPSFTITPQKIVINKGWKEYFLLIRSGIIAIILFFVFWRYWKFDFKNMEFIERRK